MELERRKHAPWVLVEGEVLELSSREGSLSILKDPFQFLQAQANSYNDRKKLYGILFLVKIC